MVSFLTPFLFHTSLLTYQQFLLILPLEYVYHSPTSHPHCHPRSKQPSTLVITNLLPGLLVQPLSLAVCSLLRTHSLDHASSQLKTFQMKIQVFSIIFRVLHDLDLWILPVHVFTWSNIKYHPFSYHSLHKYHTYSLILFCPALDFHYENFYYLKLYIDLFIICLYNCNKSSIVALEHA